MIGCLGGTTRRAASQILTLVSDLGRPTARRAADSCRGEDREALLQLGLTVRGNSAQCFCTLGMAFLTFEGGFVSLRGPPVDRAAHSSSEGRHITLFTQQEIAARNIDAHRFILDLSTDLRFISLGTGGNDDIFFKVIAWPGGAHARKLHGLPPTNFHIMLSDKDDALLDKGPNSIRHFEALSDADLGFLLHARPKCEDVLRSLYQYQPCERLFDALCSVSDRAFMLQTALEHPDWCAPSLKLGWYYYKHFSDKPTGYKCAMVYFLMARQRAPSAKVTSSIDELLQKVSKHTEWGLVCTEEEMGAFDADHIPPRFLKELLHAVPFSVSLSEAYTPELQLESRIRMMCLTNVEHMEASITLTKLPRFFRWVIPFDLAVMSTPRNSDDIQTLASAPLFFNKVVTLTEEEPLPLEWFQGTSIQNVFLPVTNYKAPTRPQVEHFIDLVVAGHRTLVHCGGGKGRAGTFIACYIATCGCTRNRQQYPVFCASEVIALVRHFRPGSIETEEQEHFIETYIANLWKQQGAPCSSIKEPDAGLLISGQFDKSVRFIILCGIQGSGKSTFARHMKDALGFTVISQDDMGSKSACEAALGFAVKRNERVIVDKCNPSVQSRKELLEIAFKPKNVLCVFFDYPVDLCIQRADSRVGHPTMPQGRASIRVKSMADNLVPPTLSEGFTCIATVRSIPAACDLLARFGVKPEPFTEDDQLKESTSEQQMIKFPRTRHMYNLGQATRDDLIMSVMEVRSFLSTKEPNIHIVVQEKIDGANLGITLDVQTWEFRVQNRSHYVNPKSHVQFKKLGIWLENHTQDLWNVLTGNETLPPGQLILYGEWLVAMHSIHYTALPDVFVAFDLYDTVQEKFYSSIRLEEILKLTSLCFIQQIHVDGFLSKELVERLVRTQSAYYDGMVEGVYIRRETDMWHVDRAKVVRGDFICGNEHWSKGQITYNEVLRKEDMVQ